MNVNRKNIASNTAWEGVVGYSRAVRVGNVVEVSGTTAVDENGALVGGSHPYIQTKFILEKIRKALEAAGATMEDVVRTRMFVRDIHHWEAIGKAHGEVFSAIRPAATMVEVSALIASELLVEIEVTAIIGERKSAGNG